ncbi:MAG: hypothetical protein AAFY76_00655 [Cyanobacteria bacterium J06649_11]
MIYLYLFSFSAVCVLLIIWGIKKHGGIYQYPFYMGLIFLSFILPQAFALVNNPYPISEFAIRGTLIMTILCSSMCWVGYKFGCSRKFLEKISFSTNQTRLFNAGIFLMAFGAICQLSLNFIPIQIDPATGNWTGPATIIYFFGQTSYVGLTIVLQNYLKNPKFYKLIFIATTFSPILFRVISGGRRSPVAGILLIIGLSLFFENRILPNRLLVAILICLLPPLIPLVGELRFDFWHMLFTGQLSMEVLQNSFNNLLDGKALELKNAAFLIESLNRSSAHGYGLGYWDSFIHQYIPGTLIGTEFKQALKLGLSKSDYIFQGNNYGIHYTFSSGSTFTGIGDSFIEFSYFGCFLFAIMGFIFRHLWISSTYLENHFSRIIYTNLFSFLHWMVTHGTYTYFATNFVFVIFCLFAVLVYAKVRKRNQILIYE